MISKRPDGTKYNVLMVTGQYLPPASTYHYDNKKVDLSTRERVMSGQMIIPNMTTVPFITIDYSFLTIKECNRILALTASPEVVVDYWDMYENKFFVGKFAVQQETYDAVHYAGGDGSLDGIKGLKLIFDGTLNDIELINIRYFGNGYIGILPETQTGYVGEEVIINSGVGLNKVGFKFVNWNTQPDGNGITFIPGALQMFTRNLDLYAIWVGTSDYTLSFNYGFGDPQLDGNNQPIWSRQVTNGLPVGVLPTPVIRKLPDGITPEPYTFIGWFSLYNGKGTQYIASTIFNVVGNTTIHAYLEAELFTITFNANGANYLQPPITQGFATDITAPYPPYKDGFDFSGWYEDDITFTKAFIWNTMPAKNITLYAKWNEIL